MNKLIQVTLYVVGSLLLGVVAWFLMNVVGHLHADHLLIDQIRMDLIQRQSQQQQQAPQAVQPPKSPQ